MTDEANEEVARFMSALEIGAATLGCAGLVAVLVLAASYF